MIYAALPEDIAARRKVFKQPSQEDLDHDFMWRYAKRLPERGRIGIFNRSYYEEVVVVRVHEHILQLQKLPASLVSKRIAAAHGARLGPDRSRAPAAGHNGPPASDTRPSRSGPRHNHFR
jgi:hypothetical protein